MGAVFFLEFGGARTLFKEVVKGLLAVSGGLLQQLRIDLFQPFETRLALKSGQFNGKLRPRDEFAGLLIGLFATLERPVKQERARSSIRSRRRPLFCGWINPEPVDRSFRHSISSAQQVDVFAKSRSWTGIGESTALRVASRRAKFIPPLEAKGFLWLFCKTLLDHWPEQYAGMIRKGWIFVWTKDGRVYRLEDALVEN